MPGDYSRKIFNAKKHYGGVLMQQGRVQLDADWNEQLAIQLYRTETETEDVIGLCGVPKKGGGFKIEKAAGGRDLKISPGRIYVGGLLCELEAQATYTAQPYYPNPDHTSSITSPPSSPPGGSKVLNLSDGAYIVFLDAWKREVTSLDDRLIREVALGGPDTTTRLQTVWQVKLLRASELFASPPTSPPSGELTCDIHFAEFDQYTASATGKLTARTKPAEPQKDPCLLPPGAGFRGLENQLYRVEVHTGGLRADATFKWSRDNASVETTIEQIDGDRITVADVGKDETLGFAGNQWVEIVDEESALHGAPRAMLQVVRIDPATRVITLSESVATLAGLPHLKLRRWDQFGGDAKAEGIKAALGDWVDLENGIQVRFSAGDYHAGDYWLIPARTATAEIEWPPYEIPNTNPIPQLPKGIMHHYCRLALIEVKGELAEVIEDCREQFPALTDICAEDVCFDNATCDFPGAETVQDALDRLCSANDLRFHNKHLHGWGIVCGLEVVCGPDSAGQQRRHVSVLPGYAIDCEGNDIIVSQGEQFDLLDMIARSQITFPSGSTDGEVCLVLELDGNHNRRFRIEPYPASKKGFQSLLDDTLLIDFYNDCIKGLVDFVRDEFTVKPGEGKTLVGPTQKRITTFTNLLIQLVNKVNGAFVFLSGEKGESGENLEDTILRKFYSKLREKLQSHTFCAMFEGARQFPDYPYSDLGVATIFSKGFQSRVRISPNSRVGYSVGGNNKINVFDLRSNEMVAEPEFPGGTSAVVQDVAFSRDGSQLYAVATLNNKDSMFVVADANGTGLTFRKPTVICDVLLLTLGTSTELSDKVFAIGKGKGLYVIDPANVNATPAPIYAFNAVGHLVIDEQRRMGFATANVGSAATDRYDRVLRLNLADQQTPAQFRTAALDQAGALVFTPGEDDIALAFAGTQSPKLYAVAIRAEDKVNKQVTIFNAMDSSTTPVPIGFTDLGENTGIRLAENPVTRSIMVTYEDSYRVGLLNRDDRLIPKFRFPVQISPVSIAAPKDSRRVYVLNFFSNTISSIPAELFDLNRQIPLKELVDYRAAVLNAFSDLLGGLLQYLKDCLCDHFLIKCPTCDPDDKIYLACVSIRNGQVFKVCNFSLRKYVKSFPTVEYWLSLVPIIPLISKAVEQFCCAALPSFFAKFDAPRPEVPENDVAQGKNIFRSAQMREGVTFTRQADFKSSMSQVLGKFISGRQLFSDTATNIVRRTVAPQSKGIAFNEVAGESADEARRKLEAANVRVEKVETFDPNLGLRNIAQFTAVPTRLEDGMRVKLVMKDDKVLYYARADEPPAQVEELRAEVEATRSVVAEARAALDQTSPRLDELRAEVEANKAALVENKSELARALPQLEGLRTEFEASRSELEKAAPKIEDLRSKVEANSSALDASRSLIDQALRMRDDLTNLRTELLQVRQTHQQELAARDSQIAELRATTKEFQTWIQLIDQLKERVEKMPPIRHVASARKKKSTKGGEPSE
ncbi:MAG: DUF6519 domain-containing protein [Blastocatellia bacterium]